MVSYCEKDTEDAGKRFGQSLHPGDVVCLHGEPGAGKSVFVRGMARGLGISDYITSPTFTLVHEYYDGALPLFHFDAYRLAGGESAIEAGLDEYFYQNGVCAVEWPENIASIIPPNAYHVTMQRDLSKGEGYRTILITNAGLEGKNEDFGG